MRQFFYKAKYTTKNNYTREAGDGSIQNYTPWLTHQRTAQITGAFYVVNMFNERKASSKEGFESKMIKKWWEFVRVFAISKIKYTNKELPAQRSRRQ